MEKRGRLLDLPLHPGVVGLLHAQPEGNVVAHGHVREQGVVLEHHGDAAVAGLQPVDRLAADAEAACRLRFETGHDPQERGLSAAGRAEQRDELTVADVERDALEGLKGAEVLADVVDGDVGHEEGPYLLEMPQTAKRYRRTAKMKRMDGRMRRRPPAKR